MGKYKCGLGGELPGGLLCESVSAAGGDCHCHAPCTYQRSIGVAPEFLRKPEPPPEPIKTSALDEQVGGDHYRKLGAHQPWEVLRAWLTPEEFRGYMKGQAIAYLARERDKGGDEDVAKAAHYLRGLLELGGNHGG